MRARTITVLTLGLAALCPAVGLAQFDAPRALMAAPVAPDDAHWMSVEHALLAAFKLAPASDPLVRADTWLQLKEPQRYASSMQDAESLKAEVQAKAGEIDAAVGALTTPLRLTLDLQAEVVEIRDGRARLSSVLNAGLYALATNFGSTDPDYPASFEFVLANHGELDWFDISQGRASEMQGLIADAGAQPAYLRVELELGALQDHKRFQTRIHQIDWYADYGRSHLVASRVDGDQPKG